MPDIKNPLESIDLAGDFSRGLQSEAEMLPSKITRYSRARERAVSMITHVAAEYQSTGSPFFAKVHEGLITCGNYLHFRHYYTVDKVRLHSAFFCKKHLFCPLCAIRRASKQMTAYLARFQVITQQHPNLTPYLVTLTVKNGPDLEERYNHLVTSLQKLTRARNRAKSGSRNKTEFTKIAAAVGSYEFTNKGNGWHPHVHIMSLCSTEIDQQELSREWHAATGDSFIVDVRRMGLDGNIIKAFAEVFKYALKFSDLNPGQHIEAATKLNGRRLLFSIGFFRGTVVPESLLDEPLDDLPFYDLFYQYIDGKGYTFDHKKSKI